MDVFRAKPPATPLLAALLLCACLPARADLFAPPFAPSDIDLAASRSFADGVATPADPDDVLAVLGFQSKSRSPHGWSAGDAGEGEKAITFQYLLAFKKPVAIGSVWLDAGELRYLKEPAPYPGDPAKEDQWVKAPAYPNQGRPRLVTLPAGVKTRAVLCTDKRSWRRSQLRLWRFSAARLHNVVPDAAAQAESEYTRYSQLGPPHTFAASRITTGTGSWQNTGQNQQERIPRPPVSDIDPSWFILSWDEPQTLVGLYLRDNLLLARIETFKGPATLSPVAAVEREWKLLEKCTDGDNGGRWLAFEPVKTTGLRLRILKTQQPQIAQIDAMHAYTDLGDAPVPEFRPLGGSPPPFKVAYSLPDDLKLTLAIDDAKGRRVRNLAARADRTKGENAESWDLKDDKGNLVAPGAYRWKALAWPPLQLRYEMTAYPNVEANAPENSPWLNGASGPGGWMADHTPPICVATAGDRVFFGAPCAESGVSFIACDLDGKKLWGIHSFAAWSGPRRMAADGFLPEVTSGAQSSPQPGGRTRGAGPTSGRGTVFVENQGWSASGEEGMDRVWGVDVATQKVRDVLMASQTERRHRGIQGMAAGGGKLYLAIDAGSGWLTNAVGIGDVDIENCLPPYKRKKRSGLDWVPDPRDDFVRLFRIKGTPPGYQCLVYLESTKGPGRKQHIVLAFTRPVALGSVAFPVPTLEGMKLKLSVLKPNAPYPPNADEPSQWTPFESHGKLPWDVVAAPPDASTRALRITFIKGADDEIADILETKEEAKELKLDAKGSDAEQKGAWLGQLEGMKLLRRRYKNLFATARVRVSSGTVAPHGGDSWDAERAEPVTEANPGIYALEWPQPQAIRGLAIMEIDGKRAEIDAWDGPAGAAIDIAAAKGWKHLATYQQPRRYFYQPDDNHNSRARYMDGYVDFGSEVQTRAIRLRIVEQWVAREGDRAGLYGVRADRGGLTLDPTRCRVYGVAPLQYLGGEPPVDPLITRRIEVVDAATGKMVKEVPVAGSDARPGPLALNHEGELYAILGTKIAKIDLEEGKHQVVVSDLMQPTAMAFDAQSNLYVFDAAPDRRVVRVYDPRGQFVRSIGTPGGLKVGPWDPTRLGEVTSLAVDAAGHLWAVEWQYWPKRISQWSAAEGKHHQDFLGNTSYGGGGVLDPWDKRRLFYGNLEFELDWQTGKSRLKNLTWENGWEAGELPVKIGDRVYVVTRPNGPAADIPVGIVYLYEKDHLRRVAAVGLANYFSALRTPEILAHLGKKVLEDFQFIWSDLNGDGQVQLAEVAFSPKRIHGVTRFNRDLGVQAGILRYQVKEFLPSGVPVYEAKEFPALAPATEGFLSMLYRLDNGSFFRMGGLEAAYTPEGETLWSYKTEGAGGHALNSASPWHPAQVVCEFGWIGHEAGGQRPEAGSSVPPASSLRPPASAPRPSPKGIGEFVVFKTNVGSWNIWTADGLLAGPVFRDIRDPRRIPWSMRDHERGLRLDDATAGQEHFSGYFCRTFEDGKYYVVAGHNHASVVEVVGVDKFQRLGGALTVAPDDVRKAQEWELHNAKLIARKDVRVIDCYRKLRDIKVDGSPSDWDGIVPVALYSDDYAKIHGIPSNATFRITFDDQCLYVCYEARGMGPLRNSGNQWDKLFKTGGAVDLQLGTDPKADPDRKVAAPGDLRLLMTFFNSQPATRNSQLATRNSQLATPIAVLYRPVAPGVPEREKWEVVSPVWKMSFDSVKILDSVQVARSGEGDRYTLEAAIPLASLGLKIEPGMRLKLDWGLLATDSEGTVVLARNYWANKATAILSDAPSEAALHPDLWGYVRFFDKASKGIRLADPKDLLQKGKEGDGGIRLELEEE